MAASTFSPAPRRTPMALSLAPALAPRTRALASAATARTAPRGEGLAPVIAMPLRDSVAPRAVELGAGALAPAPATDPSGLRVVPALRALPLRRRARAGVVAAAVIALLLAVSGVVIATTAGAGELEVAGHVVLQPGETLWDVAVRSAPAGVDPRRQLDDIRRVNGFGPGAHDAWTVVLIPAR